MKYLGLRTIRTTTRQRSSLPGSATSNHPTLAKIWTRWRLAGSPVTSRHWAQTQSRARSHLDGAFGRDDREDVRLSGGIVTRRPVVSMGVSDAPPPHSPCHGPGSGSGRCPGDTGGKPRPTVLDVPADGSSGDRPAHRRQRHRGDGELQQGRRSSAYRCAVAAGSAYGTPAGAMDISCNDRAAVSTGLQSGQRDRRRREPEGADAPARRVQRLLLPVQQLDRHPAGDRADRLLHLVGRRRELDRRADPDAHRQRRRRPFPGVRRAG